MSNYLVRFCGRHPNKVEVIEAWDEDRFHCPVPDCTAHTTVALEKGTFLLHRGCPAKNPFLQSDGSIVIPGKTGAGNHLQANMTLGGRKQSAEIIHWIIGMLRAAPRTVGNGDGQSEPLTEMWFPLLLLQASREGGAPNAPRWGCSVALVGAPAVGKTVLSMQVMDKQGYVRVDTQLRDVEVSDYIYCHQPEGNEELVFLEALYLRSIMRRNDVGLFLPSATPPGLGDLKAVFIKSAQRAPLATKREEGLGSPKGFGKWVEWAKKMFDSALGPESSTESPWYTVAFYDTAGEVHDKEAEVVRQIESACGRFAVLISAEEIFGAGGASLRVAAQRLTGLVAEKPGRVAVVVTKVDKIRAQLGNDWEMVVGLAEDLLGDRQREARRLLRGWLMSNRHAGNLESRDELARLLNRPLPVFFVWTEGWPETQTLTEQPVSYGLVRFILWCLDIAWQDINQSRPDGSEK